VLRGPLILGKVNRQDAKVESNTRGGRVPSLGVLAELNRPDGSFREPLRCRLLKKVQMQGGARSAD